MSVHTGDDLTWKWRVWIPEGKTVTLHLKWGQVPRTGVPQRPDSGLRFGSGEGTLTLTSASICVRGKVVCKSTSSLGGGPTIEIPADQAFFLWDLWVGPAMASVNPLHSNRTRRQSFSCNRVIRGRVGQVYSSSVINKMDEPTAGFIIWLEQH